MSGEARVWTAWTDRFADPEALEACRRLLSPAEQERIGRFRFERDRHLYLVAHAMLRRVLADAMRSEPRDLEFVRNRYGRPELADTRSGWRFNLSHTGGLAACVLTRACDCGIDVERDRIRDPARLAGSVLAPEELRAWIALPEAARPMAFLRYWTLKEAHSKARGMGLSLGLKTFSFSFEDGIRIRFDAGSDESAADWQFSVLRPRRGYSLAVALRTGRGRSMRIDYRDWHPEPAREPGGGGERDGTAGDPCE